MQHLVSAVRKGSLSTQDPNRYWTGYSGEPVRAVFLLPLSRPLPLSVCAHQDDRPLRDFHMFKLLTFSRWEKDYQPGDNCAEVRDAIQAKVQSQIDAENKPKSRRPGRSRSRSQPQQQARAGSPGSTGTTTIRRTAAHLHARTGASSALGLLCCCRSPSSWPRIALPKGVLWGRRRQ